MAPPNVITEEVQAGAPRLPPKGGYKTQSMRDLHTSMEAGATTVEENGRRALELFRQATAADLESFDDSYEPTIFTVDFDVELRASSRGCAKRAADAAAAAAGTAVAARAADLEKVARKAAYEALDLEGQAHAKRHVAVLSSRALKEARQVVEETRRLTTRHAREAVGFAADAEDRAKLLDRTSAGDAALEQARREIDALKKQNEAARAEAATAKRHLRALLDARGGDERDDDFEERWTGRKPGQDTTAADELRDARSRLDVARAEIELLRRQAAVSRAEADACKVVHREVEAADNAYCTLFGMDMDATLVCGGYDDAPPARTVTLDRPAKIGPTPPAAPGRRPRPSTKLQEADKIRV